MHCFFTLQIRGGYEGILSWPQRELQGKFGPLIPRGGDTWMGLEYNNLIRFCITICL